MDGWVFGGEGGGWGCWGIGEERGGGRGGIGLGGGWRVGEVVVEVEVGLVDRVAEVAVDEVVEEVSLD